MRGFLTRTQLEICKILRDGKDHTRKEIFAALPDDLGRLSNIQPHISRIRKVLALHGEDIVCLRDNKPIRYRWVALLDQCQCGK